jgi:uncharacterized membrane protein
MSARALVSKLDTSNGAMILVFGLFLFSIQDIIIKHFSSNYSVLQIVFVRGLIALGLFLLLFKFMRETISLRSGRPRLMIARGLLGFASYTCYYLAVAAMPLAEVVAITFTMPLFVTAMSALILGEKVGIRRWTAVVVGFIGVDHPLTIAYNAIVIFTCASGILSLLMLSGIISISSSHPSLAFLGRDWVMPGHLDLMLMVAIGLIAAIGFYCLSQPTFYGRLSSATCSGTKCRDQSPFSACRC